MLQCVLLLSFIFFQENARRAAEKKYAATLQEAGLDDDMLRSHSSGGRSRKSSRGTSIRSRSASRSPSRSRSPTSHSYSRSMGGTGKYSDDFDEDTARSMEEELSGGE